MNKLILALFVLAAVLAFSSQVADAQYYGLGYGYDSYGYGYPYGGYGYGSYGYGGYPYGGYYGYYGKRSVEPKA